MASSRRDDDEVRVGSKSSTPICIIKIPPTLQKAWANSFDHVGQSLGTLSGTLESHVTLTVPTSGKEMRFSISLKSDHVKSRLVSADVGDHGSNVRFEGIVTQIGTLNPPSLKDSAYLASLRSNASQDSLKTQTVKDLSQRELLQSSAAAASAAPMTLGLKRPRSEENDDNDSGTSDDEEAAGQQPKQLAAKRAKAKTGSKKKADLTPQEIRNRVFECFSAVDPETKQRRAFWKRSDLRKKTQVPLHKLGPILDEVCVYHDKGSHHKYYSLKPEYNV